jgi:hypothetical protein
MDDAFKEVWLDGRLYFRTEGFFEENRMLKGCWWNMSL